MTPADSKYYWRGYNEGLSNNPSWLIILGVFGVGITIGFLIATFFYVR